MVQGVEIVDGYIIDRDPATGEVIERVKCATAEDADEIIDTARAAFEDWHMNYSLDQRLVLLKEGLATLGESRAELALMITREMGKVASEATNEATGATEKEEWLDLVWEANRPVVVGKTEEEGGRGQALIMRDAMGVVVVLAPWNFPADEILLLSLPALMAGNCVIVKPSEVAPLTGAMVVKALASALPAGVIQVCQGDGAVGARLVSGPVDMVAMTGSSVVGKKLMAACAPDLKRLILELGGKDPMVVFADADLDRAAADAVAFSLLNCGQVCCSVERIYVDVAVKDDFEHRVVEAARAYMVGPGSDPTSRVGPMVSAMQRDMVARQVADSVQRGARVIYQSPIPAGRIGEAGNWFPVTVLGGLTQEMPIQNVETFGPVVAISVFDGSEASAIALANDSEYGLAAYVYTTDMERAKRVGAAIRAGQVGVNCYTLEHMQPECPWVGHKGSGFGYHSGADGWRQFSLPKSLIFEGPVPPEVLAMQSRL